MKLFSPHAPVPLARILEKEMDREWTQKEKNKGRVMGGGTEEKILLRVVKHNIRNDFSTCLEGKMKAERGGTLITARMGKARSLNVFMVFWFGFLGFFMLMSLMVLGSDDAPLSFKVPFFGIPFLMMLAGVAMMRFGGHSAGEDKQRILEFLAEKVKATPERGDI
ncbi:hypothetical protein [Parasphingorhabdus halotolerans]|uniref:Uncharacterized protein n=1 Tax=Parasphingorhabdus halotolerans TaxID=2725558 RepID=A0A6H2DMV0_9SPHN|nr:hypothetical protein [Parasphingorhabdus halotolerans]QJB69081.1 hypothetical protein HF685_07110 [Parasphingorhabdus halotolerans]